MKEQIARIDADLKANHEQQRIIWHDHSRYGEFGDLELTAAGKRHMARLVAERRQLEESASAAYRMPS
jgi:hypothetical protein